LKVNAVIVEIVVIVVIVAIVVIVFVEGGDNFSFV